MPLPRYVRQQQTLAGPRTSRAIVKLIAVAALIGLVIGIGWVIAGLLYFHVLR
ncbi:MAG: hypothetical protein AB7P22_14310 [Vicinamibacterales bacterium]